MKWDTVLELHKEHDKRNFISDFLNWSDKISRAVERTEPLDIKLDRLVVVGMGGSGVVGDILRDCLREADGVAVDVVKAPIIPKYVRKDDLVAAISYSGNTVETLSALRSAIAKGCRAVAITVDGELESLAIKHSIPVIKVEPSMAPRSALPQLLATTIKGILHESSLVNSLVKLPQELKKDSSEYALTSKFNRAFRFAREMWGRLPIFYASYKYESLLVRAKASLNENSKVNAYYCVFPEGYHNEVEAFERVEDPVLLPIIFKDEGDELDHLISVFDERKVNYLVVEMKGDDTLSKLVKSVLLTDVASIYLAYLRKIDPYEIGIINEVKKKRAAR